MSTPYNHKRGDSFELVCGVPARFADGYFAGYEVTSQIRSQAGVKLADLTCTWLNAATTRSLRLTCIDTTAWAPGIARLDVQFKRTSDGFVTSSTTTQMYILDDVTRANG